MLCKVKKDSGQAGMTEKKREGRKPRQRARHMGFHKRLTVLSHHQRHNMSLPLSLLVKGIRGRSGWGMGIKKGIMEFIKESNGVAMCDSGAKAPEMCK